MSAPHHNFPHFPTLEKERIFFERKHIYLPRKQHQCGRRRKSKRAVKFCRNTGFLSLLTFSQRATKQKHNAEEYLKRVALGGVESESPRVKRERLWQRKRRER